MTALARATGVHAAHGSFPVSQGLSNTFALQEQGPTLEDKNPLPPGLGGTGAPNAAGALQQHAQNPGTGGPTRAVAPALPPQANLIRGGDSGSVPLPTSLPPLQQQQKEHQPHLPQPQHPGQEQHAQHLQPPQEQVEQEGPAPPSPVPPSLPSSTGTYRSGSSSVRHQHHSSKAFRPVVLSHECQSLVSQLLVQGKGQQGIMGVAPGASAVTSTPMLTPETVCTVFSSVGAPLLRSHPSLPTNQRLGISGSHALGRTVSGASGSQGLGRTVSGSPGLGRTVSCASAESSIMSMSAYSTAAGSASSSACMGTFSGPGFGSIGANSGGGGVSLRGLDPGMSSVAIAAFHNMQAAHWQNRGQLDGNRQRGKMLMASMAKQRAASAPSPAPAVAAAPASVAPGPAAAAAAVASLSAAATASAGAVAVKGPGLGLGSQVPA